MNAVAIGPFVFDAGRLAAVLALLAFSLLAGLLARKRAGVEAWASWTVLGWLIGARIGFVALNRGDFAGQPLDALRVWQGGFDARAGWVAAAAVLALALWRAGRKVALPLAVAGLVIGLGHQAALRAMPAPVADLPPVTLMALDGRPVQLAGRDRPVVLNLWATWCPPCRREMPMMTQLAAERPGTDFVFANQGEDEATIRAFLHAEGLPHDDMLRDPSGRLMERLGAVGMPTTMVFDARGAVIGSHTGEISRAALRAMIDIAEE